ncbi:RNA polymerase sigma factor [Nonomuraea basaltis]|uniref:RNA polymerase sigma factor n=1 Tax=Nonomuraea basaltis TaxID=2495887 RepID=UPI00110C622A|nr:sigma factor [Nonomuraea basaltis]TMR89245.1 sigma-70 family RNA polymerase sigma factor [Nonomuraea basaltis]
MSRRLFDLGVHDGLGYCRVSAFDDLFRRHAPPIHRYAARRLGSHLADDIVAATFHQALKHRHSYDPQGRPKVTHPARLAATSKMITCVATTLRMRPAG